MFADQRIRRTRLFTYLVRSQQLRLKSFKFRKSPSAGLASEFTFGLPEDSQFLYRVGQGSACLFHDNGLAETAKMGAQGAHDRGTAFAF